MKSLSLTAKTYVFSISALGALILVVNLPHLQTGRAWLVLAMAGLALLALLGQVSSPNERLAYDLSFWVYGFAILNLGAPLSIYVALLSFALERLFRPADWYALTFNIGSYAILLQAAGWLYQALNPSGSLHSLQAAWAVTVVMVFFTLSNHALVALFFRWVRGLSVAKSGLMSREWLLLDFGLLAVGANSATLWAANPSLLAAVLRLAPLYLLYKAMQLPALQYKSQTDPKTGLFNAAYYHDTLKNELARADRFDRPLTVVMADLDWMREINNTYGHLAGDEVLTALAELFRKHVREYDTVARFGGEEFCFLMPETTVEQAYGRIEALREQIAATGFQVTSSPLLIQLTISFGLAGRSGVGQQPEELLQFADQALYQAKRSGRNRSVIYRPGLPSALDLVEYDGAAVCSAAGQGGRPEEFQAAQF